MPRKSEQWRELRLIQLRFPSSTLLSHPFRLGGVKKGMKEAVKELVKKRVDGGEGMGWVKEGEKAVRKRFE